MSKLLEDVREDPRREVGKFRPDLGLIVLGNSYRAWRRFCTRSWSVDGMFCSLAPDLLSPLAVKRRVTPVMKRVIAWRKRNQMSQRAAVTVMSEAGYSITLTMLQHYEVGLRTPSELVQRALERFLDEHPVIENPPRFGRWIGRDKT
jgi:hypothetical protein